MNCVQRLMTVGAAVLGVVLGTAAAQPGGGAPGAKIDLRPKFEQGQTSKYVMSITSDNERKGEGAAGERQHQQMSQEFTLSMKTVKADPEGGGTVEIVFDRVKVRLKTDDMDLSFDSDDKGGGAGGKPDPRKGPKRDEVDDLMDGALRTAFVGMVGQKLTVVYDANGNVKSVEGGAGLALPGLMESAGMGGAKDAAANIFGPISTKQSGGGLVSVGDKWKNVDDMDLSPFGRFRMVTDYQLRSAGNNRAEVTFNGRLEPATAAGGKSPVSIKNGGYRGSYVWDTKLGALRTMQSEQVTELETSAGGHGSMKSTQTVKVERKEK